MSTTYAQPDTFSIEEWFAHFYAAFLLSLVLSGTWEPRQ